MTASVSVSDASGTTQRLLFGLWLSLKDANTSVRAQRQNLSQGIPFEFKHKFLLFVLTKESIKNLAQI